MRLDALVRLIEAADFSSFRELALHCLALKGYREVTLTDGWNDGGTDVRVFQLPPNPSGIGFQITVERDWKGKLHDDAVKVKERLKLHHMTLVSSRRISEAEFIVESETIWRDYSIRVTKLDSQAIASTFFLDGQTTLALRLLGIFFSQEPYPTTPELSTRIGAAYSFVFFSEPSREFRESAIESAVVAVVAKHSSVHREQLEHDVRTMLTLQESQSTAVSTAIDRMLQRGDLTGPAASLKLSKQLVDAASGMVLLRNREWAQLTADVQKLLRNAGVRRASESAESIASDLGALLLDLARNAVDRLKSRETPFNARASHRLRHLHATLDSVGIPEGTDRGRILESLAAVAGNSGIGKALLAGELYLTLAPLGLPHLMKALGARNEIQALLDASVAIPMLTGLLYKPVNNRFSIAANHVYLQLRLHEIPIVLPLDYLEESAVHLLQAHDYAGIVDLDEDLTNSENSYVAQYANLRKEGDVQSFDEFLESFGFDASIKSAEFGIARDALKPKLQRLFGRYSVGVRSFHPSASSQHRAEKAIAHAMNSLDVQRPDILARHDARTLAYLFDTDRVPDRAVVFCTWDGVHIKARESESCEWLALNPAVLGDILSMAAAAETGPIASPVILAKSLTEEAAERGARVWDQIAAFERAGLSDAKLIKVAKEFKENYVQKAQGDRQSESIRRDWAKWKAQYYVKPTDSQQ